MSRVFTTTVLNALDRIPHHVPQILINVEALPHMRNFDIQLLGYSDVITSELCRQLGMSAQLDALVHTPVSSAPAEYVQGLQPNVSTPT